jgi:hypothetical protein
MAIVHAPYDPKLGGAVRSQLVEAGILRPRKPNPFFFVTPYRGTFGPPTLRLDRRGREEAARAARAADGSDARYLNLGRGAAHGHQKPTALLCS